MDKNADIKTKSSSVRHSAKSQKVVQKENNK